MYGKSRMTDDNSLDKDSERPRTPSSETNKNIKQEQLNDTTVSKIQNAICDSSAVDASDEDPSVITESLDETASSSVALESPKQEARMLPSLEVSQHTEEVSGKKDTNPDAESGINLLSAIEEEDRSVASLASELIDNEDNNILEQVVEERLIGAPSKDSSMDSIKTSQSESILSEIVNDKNKVDEAVNKKTSIDSNAVDYHVILKENQVIKARMKEINEQLQKTKNQIEILRNNLANYETDDELKNPRLLLSKLTAQETENENLKETLQKQNEMIESSAEKQLELSKKINRLTVEEEKHLKTLKQKQNEVERLESKITDLAAVMRTLSSSREEIANENGVTSTPISHDSIEKSRTSLGRESSSPTRQRKQKRSKICIIL